MKYGISIAIFLSSCLLAHAAPAGETETVYVQAVKVELKSSPQMNAPKVAELTRGVELKVVEKKDLWYHVKADTKEGWISKLFISSHKPVGKAELDKDIQVSLEKVSRRRSSSYAVSASTRGLSADDRVREGRELYQSDFEALQAIDKYKLKEERLDNFRQSGKLIGD